MARQSVSTQPGAGHLVTLTWVSGCAFPLFPITCRLRSVAAYLLPEMQHSTSHDDKVHWPGEVTGRAIQSATLSADFVSESSAVRGGSKTLECLRSLGRAAPWSNRLLGQQQEHSRLSSSLSRWPELGEFLNCHQEIGSLSGFDPGAFPYHRGQTFGRYCLYNVAVARWVMDAVGDLCNLSSNGVYP
jgi:hypothetical protein